MWIICNILISAKIIYPNAVCNAIEDDAAAAIAALDTGEEFAQVFAAMDDVYMNARSNEPLKTCQNWIFSKKGSQRKG